MELFVIKMNYGQLQGSSVETFFIIGKVSSEAVVEAKKLQRNSLLSRLDVLLEEILLEVRLLGMQIALWLLHLRRALTGWIQTSDTEPVSFLFSNFYHTLTSYSFSPLSRRCFGHGLIPWFFSQTVKRKRCIVHSIQ